MKFRKKPIVIDAIQFDPETHINHTTGEVLIDGLEFKVDSDQVICPTLEGPMNVSPGDWIITGVKGEKYPCKPDIFAATYERVE